MRIQAMLVATIVGLSIAAPSSAQTTETVNGRWTASGVTTEGTYPVTIDLKQDGRTITGNLVTEAKEKVTGSVDGNTISFRFQMLDPRGSGSLLSIGVKGTLDKDALSGDFTINDGPGGTFSAQRAAAGSQTESAKADASAKVDLTGSWTLAVDLGSISATPSVVFKQDGETLTGEYTSQQYGGYPLTGTVKGNQLQFTFTMTIEGNAIDVAYSGTADKDSIKGSVNYGGVGEGTFTGTRKK
jgi:hypothetical protein